MDVSLSGNKRKKAKKEKPYVSIEFDILKPGGHRYTEIDYQELKRQNAIVEEPSLDEDLHNVGAVDFIRRLEAKYSKKGKKYRFEEDDIANKNYDGYDDEEGFIDDSEAFEEQLPSTMETFKGGFYVNRGSLELKELNESQLAIDDDEEEEDDEENVAMEKSSVEEKKKEEKKKVVEPVRMVGAPPSLSRMVGGPPTMKRAFSEADRMANEAKKKKVVSATATATQSVVKKVSAPNVVKQNTSDSVIVLDDDSSVKKSTPSVSATTSIPSATSAPIITPKSTPEKVATTSTAAVTLSPTVAMQQKCAEFMVIAKTLPDVAQARKKLFQELCLDFIQKSVKYSSSGKKQLDYEIIDAILKIDELYKKEQVNKTQREKVLEQLASFLSVHRATLSNKIQSRINELEEKKKADKDDDIQVISTKASSSTGASGSCKIKLGDVKHWNQDDVNMWNNNIASLRSKCSSVNDLTVAYAIQEANKHRWNVALTSQKVVQYKPTPDMVAALTPLIASAPAAAKPTRKSRVYLNVWVKESTEYWNLMKKTNKLSNTVDTSKLAEIREVAVKMLKASSEKSKEAHKKAVEDARKNDTSVPNFSFNFSDTLIGTMSTFLDEIYIYALSQNKPSLSFSAINSLHEVIKEDVAKAMFFIEVSRRLPKVAFVLELPEVKKILSEAKLFVEKFQVVQNLKYVLKWPEGTGPGSKVTTQPPQLAASTSSSSTSSIKPLQPVTSKSAVSLNQQPSTSSASAPKSNSATPQKLAQTSPEKLKAAEQLLFAQLITRLQQNPSSAALILTSLRAQYGDTVIKMLEERMRQQQSEEAERKRCEELEKQRKVQEELERQRKIKEEMEKQRKIKEEMERQRKIKEELEKRRKLEEAERRRKAEEAEVKRRLKLEEKLRKEKEAKEKREREIREARERKEREERERQEAQEALKRFAEEQRKIKEKLESEKAAERARELEIMRSRQREEEREMKPVVPKALPSSSYSNTNQYHNEPPPIRIKQEPVETVVTQNLQNSYPTTTSQSFNNYNQHQQQNSYQSGSNGMQNHQIASSSSSEYLGSPQMVQQNQNSMMGQSPQQYMMSPNRNNAQQYAQNIIQQNMMYGIQQQQQQMMRQQQVQPPATQHQHHQQQQQYGWNNMMDQQQQHQQRQNQNFAAQLHQQQQLQRQLQMQQQQQLQQQQQFQQNFQNYGNGYNNPR